VIYRDLTHGIKNLDGFQALAHVACVQVRVVCVDVGLCEVKNARRTDDGLRDEATVAAEAFWIASLRSQ